MKAWLRIRFSCMVWAVLLVVLLAAGASSADDLTVHFLDVGQGDAIAVETPEGRWVLVDGGTSKAGTSVLIPFFRKSGVTSIDMVVITHPHADHIGGLRSVIEGVNVKRIIADGQIHTTKTYEQLLLSIESLRIPFSLARRGQLYGLGSGVTLAILHPEDELSHKDLNNNSTVVRIDYGQVSFLLTGDIEEPAEAELINSQGDSLQAEVLKVAHHGSSTSTSSSFLDHVSPKVAIISCGGDNRYGHPAMSTIARLKDAGVRIHRTDLDGTIVIETDGALYLKVSSISGTEVIPLEE